MKYRLLTILSFFMLASFSTFALKTEWPKTFNTTSGVAKLYEPQPESYQKDILKVRAAVSLLRTGKSDPVFGVLWADVNLQNGQGNSLHWQTATVTNIKFPGETNDAELDQLSLDLQKAVPSWNITIDKNDLMAKLANSAKVSKLADNLATNPPKIIYSKNPSILVLIDGQPQFSNNSDWDVEQVRNTPFTLVKNTDQQFYLYGDKRWYRSSSVTGPYSVISQVPSRLGKMDQAVRANDTSAARTDNSVSDILVSTEPAELIQSNGEANFTPIQGTNLLYMSNTSNDVFMDVNSQQYYVLISGRWYSAPNLNSSWKYIPSDNLPADFAKIPEGSPKDVVLANVAGTGAANESVMEAQVPQTAKVDRKKATANVVYDGDPSFENIEGTDLTYAVNTPGTVLNSGKQYYYVENGVWFTANSANGPWIVATQRPAEVENIPPSYPVYNAKYVYIYDATPDYVYMGYTPGYLGNYIYGPTIVYGTGYYYKPWRGRYYYPRATTWGFNMRYNPWTGWNFGVDFWGGWFSLGIGSYYNTPYWGGWWGPQVYRPAYCRPYNYNYGYYGRNSRIANNYTIINNNRSNNIYRYRGDVVTHDRPRFDYSRAARRPGPTNNNAYSNGRYNNNNGRVIPGNNNNGDINNRRDNNNNRRDNNGRDNQGQDQRPARTPQGDRNVVRPYQPNQSRSDRNNNTGRDNGENNSGTPGTRPGGIPQTQQNGRIYTPGDSRNNRNAERSPAIPQNRQGNGTINNPRPQASSPDVQNRPANPSSSIENRRTIQDRPVRAAQDRSNSPVTNRPQPQPQPQQQQRQVNPVQSRPANPINASPAPRVERVERPSRESGGGGEGSRPQRGPQGRAGREN